MQYRTHTCNELRLADAGKQVRLSGWMENVREVSGNLAFIVLRDFYGSTQLVAEDEKILQVFVCLVCLATDNHFGKLENLCFN